MPICIDIETTPQCPEALEKRMPEEIRNPQMPAELASPEQPNFAERCPQYGLPELRKKMEAAQIAKGEADGTQLAEEVDENADAGTKKAIAVAREKVMKARTAAADKLEAATLAVNIAEKKREEWMKESQKEFAYKADTARALWEAKAKDARRKFVDGAALDPRLGHVKLIGMRDTETGMARIFVWEPDAKKIKAVRAWFSTLPVVSETFESPIIKGVRMFRGRMLAIHEFQKEDAMLLSFFTEFRKAMFPGAITVEGMENAKCVTYYGNGFDFPFMHKRAWILGKPIVPIFRRGRFWDESRMVDLHELWTFGDRQERTGGLDGLAEALGFEGAKTQSGGSFHEFYNLDPAEGITYLLNDIWMTEFCGTAMGVIPETPDPEPDEK